jgi:hypothetical protein
MSARSKARFDMLPQISRVGCIHFDEAGSTDPISTIKAALAHYGEGLSDVLIVLPEALDLGKGYYSENAPSVFAVGDLEALSRDLNVAFVAGLKEKRFFGKPFNSAFLIDPERTRLLSRKMHGDNNALWYAPMRRGYVKDIDYRGLTVASLICQDATGFGSAPNSVPLHERILDFLRGGPSGNSPVLCVPARMTTCTPSLEENEWPQDISVVVANVKTIRDRPSGIRAANREWRPCLEGICLERLPSGSPVTS